MEHLTLFLILGGALALLISNRLPPDGVGLGVIILLMVTGQASPAEAFLGLSHPATLTVAAVLVLSAGVQRTGVGDAAALWLRRRARNSESLLLTLQTLVVAPISAFLSNTATVAAFLPVVLSVTRDRGYSASRFLIPLSFASLLGGMSTVIGTSTNIVVASLVADRGLEPMRMFDFAPVGIAIGILGSLYLIFIAPRLLPERRESGGLEAAYQLRRYLTEVEIPPGSHLAGLTLEEANLRDRYDLEVLEIHRGTDRIAANPRARMQEKDVLLVYAPLTAIQQIQASDGIALRTEAKLDLDEMLSEGMILAEAIVPPGSPLDHRTLQQWNFRNRRGVTALALYHRREVIRERVGRTPLRIGDVLLLFGPRSRMLQLAANPEVLSVVQLLPPRPRRALGRLSVLVVLLTVGIAATGAVSLVKAVVAGAALMVLLGCLTLREAYRSIDRRTILLLAGMISLGLAMDRSGAARFVADGILEHAGGMGPLALLAVTYLATALFTEFVTNNACAVIMTPLAIAAAVDFGYDTRPFVFTVAYAASASFLTPWGYQTNMFIYGPGGYKFVDFARVGLPLSLICMACVVLLVPLVFPFQP